MRIIYFDIDCLRPDHLGCYGYARPTSPTIDAIAEQGMIFNHFYCANSPCLPSRTAWASGRFGVRNGVCSNHGAGARFYIRTRNYVGPQEDCEMLTRHLRANGYDTYSFSNFADRHNALWFMYGWTGYHTPNLKGGGEMAWEVNEPVIEWLQHNASRENYLLHINYWDVHRVYKMADSWGDRFKDVPVPQDWPDEETIQAHQAIDGPFTARRQFRDGKSPYSLMPDAVTSRQEFEHMVTGYDVAIAYTDHHLKLVLDELDRQGVLDDAVIIISGDHGDAFGEHGIYSDHVCADECIHRIPLIVRWPGITAPNTTCDSLLYNVDLGATLCDAIGAPVPEDWDGESFWPNLRGDSGLERDYLVWDHGLYTVQRAVRTRRHLMVRTYDNFGYNCFQPLELYDMIADPFQTTNIAEQQPEVVDRCSRYMLDWLQEQRDKGYCIEDPLVAILEERGELINSDEQWRAFFGGVHKDAQRK